MHVNCVMHIFDQVCEFYISLFTVNHLLTEYNLIWNICQFIMEERNVQIVRDPRKSY